MTDERHFTPPPYLSYFLERYGRARLDLASSGRPERKWEELEPHLRGKPLYSPTYQEDARLFAETFSARYGLERDFGMLPVPGSSTANYLAVNALVPPGGLAAVESPVYDPVPYAVRASGRRVVEVPRPPSRGWSLDLEALEGALREGARLVFLTNLHNPSGAFLDRETLMEADALLARYGAWGLVDEIYLEFRRSWREETALAFTERFLVSSSLTKVYGLGGLKTGWLAGPREAVERCGEYWMLVACNNPSPAFFAAAHLAPALEGMLEADRPLLERNAALFRSWVEAVGLEPPLEAGSPLRLLALPEGVNDLELAERAYRDHGLFLAPGSFFGAPGRIRVGLFKPTGVLEEGLDIVAGLLGGRFA